MSVARNAEAAMDYRFEDGWAKLPAGWRIGDVGGVAVDAADRVYVFNRGEHPMLVFDRSGELVDHWGEGVFTSPHGLEHGWDGHLYCTDDGDHTVRKFDKAGALLLQIGVPGRPSGFMSGEPFNRCTHTALAPNGDLYVSDGYRNACIHCFSASGTLRHSWGRSGSGRGEFYVPHNLLCDRDGTVYVADRENHRVQLFDADGRWRASWDDVHRPMALALHAAGDGAGPQVFVGEAGPSFNRHFPNLGPRLSVFDTEGRLLARFGDIGFGHAADRFLAPHGIAVDSHGDVYVGEVAHAAWPSLHPGEPVPDDLRTLRKLVRVR